MGLIELCLLSFLSPQEPAPTPTPAVEQAAPEAAPAEAQNPPTATAEPEPSEEPAAQDPATAPAQVVGDAVERLRAAEAAGADADPNEFVMLTHVEDAAVAARAAWVLANGTTPEHMAALSRVLETSSHADARLQALQGMLRRAEASQMPTAIKCLDDVDRRVRTLAVQLLGKLRRPASLEPIVGLVDTYAASKEPGPATDVQAALLALTDLGAAQQLLRVATAIHYGSCTGTGNQLHYAFQTLTPSMTPEDELTLVIAVLGHRESALRRYAITRLAELGKKSALSALEGRLGAEGPELRPLVEVALAQIRRDHQKPPSDEVERAVGNTKALWAKPQAFWNKLEPQHQAIAAAIPVALLVFVGLLRRRARKKARAAEAAAAAAMVAPSDDYYEDEDREDGEYYDEQGYEDDAALAGQGHQDGRYR